MNDAHRAGVSARLEIRISAKDYVAASGARHAVLRDLALTIEGGKVGAVFGPSGCGKTTLLRMVAGLDRAFEGAVTLRGHGDRPARIGMVFQEPRLLPWRTVEENVRLAAPAASDGDIDRLFETFGLMSHRAHHPNQLSLGLARRVALMRAFAVEPELLLLDEPFVSLDAALAAKLRQALADLIEQRRVTTLLVTHDIDEAIGLADVVFMLSDRPARIVAAVPVDLPRGDRTPERIAALRRDLIERGIVRRSFAEDAAGTGE